VYLCVDMLMCTVPLLFEFVDCVCVCVCLNVNVCVCVCVCVHCVDGLKITSLRRDFFVLSTELC